MITTASLTVGGEAFAMNGGCSAYVICGTVVALSGSGVARVDFGIPWGVVSFNRNGWRRANAAPGSPRYLIDGEEYAKRLPRLPQREGPTTPQGDYTPEMILAYEHAVAQGECGWPVAAFYAGWRAARAMGLPLPHDRQAAAGGVQPSDDGPDNSPPDRRPG